MAGDSISVTFDSGLMKFLFDPDIYIWYINDELGTRMGIPSSFSSQDYSDLYIDRSIIPIDMNPIRNIVVNTGFSVFNFQISSFLGVIPVDVDYGDFIQYKDYASQNQPIITDHAIKFIEVSLVDDNGDSLDSYLESLDDYESNDFSDYYSIYPEWSVVLDFTPVENKGFVSII